MNHDDPNDLPHFRHEDGHHESRQDHDHDHDRNHRESVHDPIHRQNPTNVHSLPQIVPIWMLSNHPKTTKSKSKSTLEMEDELDLDLDVGHTEIEIEIVNNVIVMVVSVVEELYCSK